MSTISLRAYIREIESMIDQGRIDEAIAHCKQILSKFPKHIETYRLLGKAYLENNQNSNAADIFQRVLSAVPDDFISHVGMSLIREEEGNLISAVEHMERAFEKEPYNNAIQEELRRLYGKRDGVEPSKVRLTQGALARIYLKGDLVNQGIGELRAAVAENPERYDLKTLLIQAYLEVDQMAKAIDLASDILKKYPFNITANRILANTLKTHDHPQEMAICRKRLFALSPYEAYISEHAPTLGQVPDRAITLEKLSWDERRQSLRTRTREIRSPWSNNQELEPSKSSDAAPSSIPDWLSTDSQEEEEKEEGNLMPEENPEQSFPSNQDQGGPNDNPPSEESIPDWLKDAGWELSDGTVDESQPVFNDEDEQDELALDDDQLVPAEIPDWLEEAAPTSLEEPQESTGAGTPSIEGESAEPDAEFADDYFSEQEQPAEPDQPGPDWGEPASAQDQVSEDRSESTADSEAKTEGKSEDIPSWLKNLELDEDSQETAIAWLENMPASLLEGEEDTLDAEKEAAPAAEMAEQPEEPAAEQEWMEDYYQASVEEEAAPAEELSASDLLPEDEEDLAIFEQGEISAGEEELPSWLEELGQEEEPASQVDGEPLETELTPEEPAPTAASAAEDEFVPDWLSDFEEQPETEPAPAEQEPTPEEPVFPPQPSAGMEPDTPIDEEGQPEIDIPDWMGALEEDEETQVERDKTPDFDSESNSLAWLESLAADEPLEEADIKGDFPAEEPQEEAPPSMSEEEVKLPTQKAEELEPSDFGEADAGPSTIPQEEEALPAWLSNLDRTEEEAQPPADEEPPPSTPDAPQPESAPHEVAPDDETLSTEIPDWLAGFSETEAEEEPGTDELELPAETRSTPGSAEWLDQIEEQPLEDYQEDEFIQEEPQEVEEPEMDDSFSWLEDLKEEAVADKEAFPEESVREESPPEETAEQAGDEQPSAEEMPAWLSELDLEEETESLKDAIQKQDRPLTEEEKEFIERSDEDDIADWLSTLEQSDASEAAVAPDLDEEKDLRADFLAEESEEVPPADVGLEEEEAEDTSAASGMLERLKAREHPREPEPDLEPEPAGEPEVPQWLEDLKKEEDPQETAILWLQQFVESGGSEDISQQIKRYTDELDPGDSVPEWMEDLKQEEDPQTTAMLWLEKLESEREQKSAPQPKEKAEDDSGWLAELEKEEQQRQQETAAEKEDRDEFFDDGADWLADLESEQPSPGEEKIEEWKGAEPTETEAETASQGETPPWMKATSPLEGDFLTDELEGGPQQEDVEIPAWLAGYTEEELAEQERLEEAESTPEAEVLPEEEPQPDAEPGEEEYGWFSAEHTPSETPGMRIDLNKAAISQLESIIGISYQVAKGIVSYREKHGPYQSLKDLLNVPEIQDDQTIEILKPEIIIHAVEPAPDEIAAEKSTSAKAVQPEEEPTAAVEEKPEEPEISAQPEAEPAPEAPAVEKPVEKSLTRARQMMKDGEVEPALNEYEALIENGDQLDEVITDLKQASLDHPVNVLVMKTLGDAYMQQDQLQEALDAYSKAEELLR